MINEYRKADFDKVLDCPNCHWKGKGADAAIVDFYGIGKTQEVHCPNAMKKLVLL